ncbi:MAG: acetyl-CoA carboxylase biotin carboxyl carrier protein subunit [Dehalococcoidia bacterium]|nr:acetyl-CoA carboxylase biotin carboxyl carrier protein subunit [Dehalococcoidia bacterium]MBK9544595.1 acetyl-CoA carboxylase biotin carboxyl carrier protein subunit [Dehalococcoidia bacterium]MCC6265964.1 acetyl-CoA carboxylase biotin carboxyl carrier protein subunit [Dehalococcoidia bacterium]
MQDLPAPMTGTVKELLVGVGDQVSVGDELVIIESMKMEIPVESPVSGTVVEFVVEPPGKVEEGDLLLRLEV